MRDLLTVLDSGYRYDPAILRVKGQQANAVYGIEQLYSGKSGDLGISSLLLLEEDPAIL